MSPHRFQVQVCAENFAEKGSPLPVADSIGQPISSCGLSATRVIGSLQWLPRRTFTMAFRDVLSRLRFDPNAPPAESVALVLQMSGPAGGSSPTGTCRGFVRSSFAFPGRVGSCKYGASCRYAHDLSALTAGDLA